MLADGQLCTKPQARVTVEQSRPGVHKRVRTYQLLGKGNIGRHDAGLHRAALCKGIQVDNVEQRGRGRKKEARRASNLTKSSRQTVHGGADTVAVSSVRRNIVISMFHVIS